MEEKIKVLAITPNRTGVGYYRSINPHVFIDEKYPDEFEINIFDSFNFNDPNFGFDSNIVHFHASACGEVQKLIPKIKALQRAGVKMIMDLDDYWMLPTSSPQYRMYNQQHKFHEKIFETLRIVDAVTTTTSIFANEIKKFNKNVFVIPNAIDPREPQFKKQDIKSERLRVGIICGSSHEKDIELLQGTVNQLKGDMDKIQIVICGFDLNGNVQYYNKDTNRVESRPIKPEETAWTKYEKILTDNFSIITPQYRQYLEMYTEKLEFPGVENMPYRRYWTKPVNKYATHYNNVDVLLVPLVENKFNSVKSQLKVIETAFFNKAIIAQDFGPYKIDLQSYVQKGGEINENGNALLVDSTKNHKQWAKHIKFLLNNPDARQKMADNLTNKITKEYCLEEVTKTRVQLYKNITKKETI